MTLQTLPSIAKMAKQRRTLTKLFCLQAQTISKNNSTETQNNQTDTQNNWTDTQINWTETQIN